MSQQPGLVTLCHVRRGEAFAHASDTNPVAASDINSVPGDASDGVPAAEQSPTRPATEATDTDEQSSKSGAQQQRPTDDAVKAHELR